MFFCYNTKISPTPISHSISHKRQLTVASSVLAVLILALSASSMKTTHADGVCGDSYVDAGEQCDDGDLSSGDGCSSQCTVEQCGNGTTDANEQCDNGSLNGKPGSQCSINCFIQFCGDHVTQVSLGEECDDGNGLSNDGCSALCKNENPSEPDAAQSSSSSSSASSESATEEQAKAAAATEATALADFLATPAGQDYKNYLSAEQSIKLQQILETIQSGRALNAEEKRWAEDLIRAFENAKIAERQRYTDLLKQFIATPISSDVVEEKNLERDRLIDVEVPVAITELARAVEVLQRGELQKAVTENLTKLKRQDIDLLAEVPVDTASTFHPDQRPINVFTALKALKDGVEHYATTDLAASLAATRAEVQAVRDALPLFQREYGIDLVEADKLLDAIDAISLTTTKQDTTRIVNAINAFITSLERQNILSLADRLAGKDVPHAAAGVERIAESMGESFVTSGTSDPWSLIEGLSAGAPEAYKNDFAEGTVQSQQAALIDLIEQDPDVARLLSELTPENRQMIDSLWQELRADIGNVGATQETDTLCDDSMTDALRCTQEYLAELQDTVRSENLLTNVIGTLQDYFNIHQ